jgi:hypothetical protein
MTAWLLPLQSSPFNNKIYSCYVYSVHQLSIYITSQLHKQSSAALTVSNLFCNTVLTIDNTFQEYADMQLILSKVCGCSCKVWKRDVTLMLTSKPMHILCTDHHIKEISTVRFPMAGHGRQKNTNSVCERLHTGECIEENPHTNVHWLLAAEHVACTTSGCSMNICCTHTNCNGIKL